MKKQTALEFLLNQVHEYGMIEFEKLFDIEIKEAKEMEKEQILNASRQFADYPFDENDIQQYYNETFNK